MQVQGLKLFPATSLTRKGQGFNSVDAELSHHSRTWTLQAVSESETSLCDAYRGLVLTTENKGMGMGRQVTRKISRNK